MILSSLPVKSFFRDSKIAISSAVKMEVKSGNLPLISLSLKMAPNPTPASDLEPSVYTDTPSCSDICDKKVALRA